ncbi:MAG TPA: DPP IV N-terminal domain-containing protein, partial [Cytophaga sp.]|nr:DPP IV N-terminal domain-containing protein [Cytophaga sp.]
MHLKKYPVLLLLFAGIFFLQSVTAQFLRSDKVQWTKDGNSYYSVEDGNIEQVSIATGLKSTLISKGDLVPADRNNPIIVESFKPSDDDHELMIFTNSVKVWRYHTKGDFWVLDIAQKKLMQLGKGLPPQSLMFAKFSPDGKKAAYVSGHNIYSEDIATGKITQLTFDGTRKFINGTFDWVYEEEFGCRDGFRWSPDGNKIAFWQVDATKIRDYYMLNTTDSVYSHVIPVEYPKVGESPSPVRIGVIDVNNPAIQWMNIEGDPQQHYLPRMEWADANTLVVQQLDRKQQDSKLIYCNATTGNSNTFYTEHDDAWIDIKSFWNDDDPAGWDWIDNGQNFIWIG